MKQVISNLRTIRARRIYAQPAVVPSEQSQSSSSTSTSQSSPVRGAAAAAAGDGSAVSPRSSSSHAGDDIGPSESLLIEEVATDGHWTPEQRSKRVPFEATPGGKRDTWKLIPDLQPQKPRGDDQSELVRAPKPSPSPPLPVLTLANDLQHLPSSLRQLSNHMSATETTRTSLISTINAYTSHLHTQNFLMVRGGGGGGRASRIGNAAVGLSSLDDNLRKEGAAAAGDDARTRSEPEGMIGIADLEEWETVRKEIRSIKGLMLSR